MSKLAATFSGEVLVSLLETCPAACLVVQAGGALVAANAAARARLGGGLVGRAVREVLGVGWRELEVMAAEGKADLVVDLPFAVAGQRREGWRIRPERLRTVAGETAAVAAFLDEPVAGGLPSREGPRANAGIVPFEAIFGEDPRVVATKQAAERFARTRLPILLIAETGTGKDLLARAIHAASPRRDRPFVAINCGALSPHLLESELFGYAPGAFTDARREGQEGKIGAARGGTLFLDEVAEMPGPLQALLLRVLEDGTYYRVGENVPRQADIRLLCATCRDLPRLVEEGAFRQDLFFRIAGACLSLPPVRERDDVGELVLHVLAGLIEREWADVRPAPRLGREAFAWFVAQRWPGNVRQLKTALQYALVLSDGGEIRPEHLPPSFDLAPPRAAGASPAVPRPAGTLDALEAELVRRTVAEEGGNLSAAAKKLGIARSTLYRYLRRGADVQTG